MSISKLPSGRYGAQIYDPAVGGNVRVSKVLGRGYESFATKREAKAARELARERVAGQTATITVAGFRERWTTDPLFATAKDSTRIVRLEQTKAFAARYGKLPMDRVSDEIVAEWLAGAKRAWTVPGLRAMWNAAATAKAGRLVKTNPWAGLGLERSTGNRHKQPPTEEMVWRIIAVAREESGPDFAAWLQVAAFTGMRPGELDALRPERVNFKTDRIDVVEQFNAATRTFTLPKNGETRPAILTPPARDALLALPRDREFCFENLRGDHMTSSSRSHHWKAVRAAVGWTGTLYLATRHFAGWYMVNVLELDSEDVAIALGHTDGGDLVRRLYGHREAARSLERVQNAYQRTDNVRPLRIAKEAP